MNIGMVMMMCKTVFDLFCELLEQISKGGHGCVAHDRLSLSDCEKMRRNPDTDQNTERIAGDPDTGRQKHLREGGDAHRDTGHPTAADSGFEP